VLVTTTLVVVLFTTIGLGGSTMPFIKYLESHQPHPGAAYRRRRGRRRKEITMSKTRELGATIDSEHLSELTEEELDLSATDNDAGFSLDDSALPAANGGNATSLRSKGFLYFDLRYLRPFLTRKFTQRELKEGQVRVTNLAEQWIHGAAEGGGGASSPLVLTDSEGELSQNLNG